MNRAGFSRFRMRAKAGLQKSSSTRAARQFCQWIPAYSRWRSPHLITSALTVSAATAVLLYSIIQRPALLEAQPNVQAPRDEQQIVQDTYVRHMDDLRSKATRNRFYTAAGDVVRIYGIQHASNSPSEDEMTHEILESSGREKWAYLAVFDGHAGGATSKLLKKTLITDVAKDMLHITSENDVDDSIRSTFTKIDNQIISRGLDVLKSGSAISDADKTILAQAYAGSCALLAMFNPSDRKLRIAVTGDSRAVLGRFSPETGAYEALPMSIDQNGKNPMEKERMDRDHPGEDKVINPRSGRVLGIAISRSFGDSRWKWSEEESLLANEKFGGPRMRGLGPPGSVKTPPYLIAEPEIKSTNVTMGPSEANADFLIMASDGFWDHISNEDAVTCVAEWVQRNASSSKAVGGAPMKPITDASDSRLWSAFGQPSPITWPLVKGSGIWGDWRMKPRDFVYEEHNAATHLVQNAFGGASRSLFCGAMAETYPLSRYARDDISVYVVFFGKVGGKTILDEPSFRVI